MSRADPAASSKPLADVPLSWRLPYLLKTGIAPVRSPPWASYNLPRWYLAPRSPRPAPDTAAPFVPHGRPTSARHSSAGPRTCDCPLVGAPDPRPRKRTLRVGLAPVRRSAPTCLGSVDPRPPLPPSRFVSSSLPWPLPFLLPGACFPYTTCAIL